MAIFLISKREQIMTTTTTTSQYDSTPNKNLIRMDDVTSLVQQKAKSGVCLCAREPGALHVSLHQRVQVRVVDSDADDAGSKTGSGDDWPNGDDGGRRSRQDRRKKCPRIADGTRYGVLGYSHFGS